MELDLSLSGKRRKSMAGHICEIALKTIPRCGTAALILLCMGFYFLFPACEVFQQIWDDRNTPYELTATTDSGSVDLNTLMQIDGVEKISPVLNFGASLVLGDYTLDSEIRAVYSSFLNLRFTEGTMYPDSSNMPYLILNKAATKSFSQEYQTITVSAEDTVMMNANGTKRKAIVCGVFDDGSEIPAVYMSYEVAQKEYGYNGQTELIFLLENKGAAENVVSSLQRHHIHADFDSSITLAWELLQKQGWQTFFLSISLLTCATVLIRKNRASEIAQYRPEMAMLLLSGITSNTVGIIYPLRIILTETPCMIAASVISTFTGAFSIAAIGIGACCACIIGIVILFPKTSARDLCK